MPQPWSFRQSFQSIQTMWLSSFCQFVVTCDGSGCGYRRDKSLISDWFIKRLSREVIGSRASYTGFAMLNNLTQGLDYFIFIQWLSCICHFITHFKKFSTTFLSNYAPKQFVYLRTHVKRQLLRWCDKKMFYHTTLT